MQSSCGSTRLDWVSWSVRVHARYMFLWAICVCCVGTSREQDRRDTLDNNVQKKDKLFWFVSSFLFLFFPLQLSSLFFFSCNLFLVYFIVRSPSLFYVFIFDFSFSLFGFFWTVSLKEEQSFPSLFQGIIAWNIPTRPSFFKHIFAIDCFTLALPVKVCKGVESFLP